MGTFPPPPPLSEPGVPISGTGLSSGVMRLAHEFPVMTSGRVLASRGTKLAPLRRPGRCVVRPVNGLPTAPTGTRLIVVINQGWGILNDR